MELFAIQRYIPMCSLFNRVNCIQDDRINGSGPSLVCTVASCSSPTNETDVRSKFQDILFRHTHTHTHYFYHNIMILLLLYYYPATWELFSRRPSEIPKRYPAPGSLWLRNSTRLVDRNARKRLPDPTGSKVCSRTGRGVAAVTKTSFWVSWPPRATRTASRKFRYCCHKQDSVPCRRKLPPGHPINFPLINYILYFLLTLRRCAIVFLFFNFFTLLFIIAQNHPRAVFSIFGKKMTLNTSGTFRDKFSRLKFVTRANVFAMFRVFLWNRREYKCGI